MRIIMKVTLVTGLLFFSLLFFSDWKYVVSRQKKETTVSPKALVVKAGFVDDVWTVPEIDSYAIVLGIAIVIFVLTRRRRKNDD